MKNQTWNVIGLILIAVTLAGTTLPVRAADPAADKPSPVPATDPLTGKASPVPAADQAEDDWLFIVTPIAWLAGINGHATLRGHTVDLDVSFDEILDHLVHPPLMLYLEVRKNKFGFYGQPNYLKLSDDGGAGPFSFDDALQLWIVEGGGFYEIGKWGQDKPITLDVIAGMRYWNIHNELKLKDANRNLVFNSADTVSLYDPLIGLRASKHLTEKLSINLRGDIGGFGISSDTSDFSWQAAGTLGYDLTKRLSFYAGYRALAVDKETGNGAKRNGANLILNGALLGFEFRL